MSNIHNVDTDIIDKVVSQRIKMCRISLGLTQADLGKALNVSVQQIQKYENNINRITSGKLQAIANLCNVSVSHFFDQTHDYIQLADLNNLSEKDLISFVKSFQKIPNSNLRKIIVELTRTIGDTLTVINH